MRRHGYIWGMLQAAHLAEALGIPRISVVEFGVAGGNGLVALERIAAQLEPVFKVAIDVIGFDTGAGLPPPQDYRDIPNLCDAGDYRMDVDVLRARLQRARLILGPIARTVPEFLATEAAPVGFVSIDVDYYSSTVDSLRLFEGAHGRVLPRVMCYLDDILGFTHSEFTGELLAVREFNDRHPARKISALPGLRYFLEGDLRFEAWTERLFFAHFFEHPLYARNDGLIRVRRLALAQGRPAVPIVPPAVAEAFRRAEAKAALPLRERVVIFGASLGGERVLASLPSTRLAVAFADNDIRRHGSSYHGLPVVAPAALKNLPHERVLIASSAYREIFLQLAAMGLPLDRLEIVPHAVRNGSAGAAGQLA